MGLTKEETLAVAVMVGIAAVFIYRSLMAPGRRPRTPDPWGKEMEAAVNRENAVPLCHHCLAPQEHTRWFCPECGATVGPYANYMPYVYVFAQGEVLRTGSTERVRRSPFVIAGFVLFSITMFSFFAPVYWWCLLRNLQRLNETPAEHEPPVDDSSAQ